MTIATVGHRQPLLTINTGVAECGDISDGIYLAHHRGTSAGGLVSKFGKGGGSCHLQIWRRSIHGETAGQSAGRLRPRYVSVRLDALAAKAAWGMGDASASK
jgi:hypothetical protein